MMISSNQPIQSSKYSTMMMASKNSEFRIGQQDQFKRSGPISAAMGAGLFKRFRKDPAPTQMVSTTTKAYLNDFTET